MLVSDKVRQQRERFLNDVLEGRPPIENNRRRSWEAKVLQTVYCDQHDPSIDFGEKWKSIQKRLVK
jgi:hypothetical protein